MSRSFERLFQALQARLRPNFFEVVVVPEGWCAPRKLKPGHFAASINMDVRPQRLRVVESSNTDESDLPAAAVITPKSDLTFSAAVDVVRTRGAMNRHRFQGPPDYSDRRTFDDGVEDEGAAGVPLTIRAVATMHAHRRRQQLITHIAAGTTTPKFLFHVVSL